jgi:hypothetical protein
MSNQQNNNAPLDDDVPGAQQLPKRRPRNFYRKRPGLKVFFSYLFLKLFFNIIGNERQNQDLGEDENRASNDDDVQGSNNFDENNQPNDEDNVNNTRGIFIILFK